jgi:hypothetical protein
VTTKTEAPFGLVERDPVIELLQTMSNAAATGHSFAVDTIATALATALQTGGPSVAALAWATSTLRAIAQLPPLPPVMTRPHDWQPTPERRLSRRRRQRRWLNVMSEIRQQRAGAAASLGVMKTTIHCPDTDTDTHAHPPTGGTFEIHRA